MKATIFGGVLAAVLAITSAAKAQTNTPGINQKEFRLDRRISDDFRRGRLTPGQASRLRFEEGRLAENKHMAGADGLVGERERAHLRREESRIYWDMVRIERRNGFNSY